MRTRFLRMIPVLCLSILPLAGRADAAPPTAASTAIERAMQRDDESGLLSLRDSLAAASQSGHADKYAYYYLGLADYELAQLEQDEAKASDYIDAAEDALQTALKQDADFAEAEALLGSSYGVEIGLHPFKGMWLGAKVGSHLTHAAKLAPGDPRVSLLQGISDYETPETYGGDKQRAVTEFHAALAAFDTYPQPDDAAPTWGRAETHVWLAEAEAGSKDFPAARADLTAALGIAPDYKYAQHLLDKLPPATQGGNAGQGGAVPAVNSFAIRQVDVFDGTTVLRDEDVIVKGGLIASIGQGLTMPAGLAVIDGHGKMLLPGLIDAHVHTWGGSRADALRFGVTTELDMFSDWHLLAGAKAQRGSIVRTDQADLWSSGTLATVPGGHGTEYGLDIPTLTSADQAQAWVDARVREGSDYIKIILEPGYSKNPQPTLSAAEVQALITAAHHDGKMAMIHIHRLEDARLAVEDGVDGLAHVFEDKPADAAFVKLALAQHLFVVPTLTVYSSASCGPMSSSLAGDSSIKSYLSKEQTDMLAQGFGFCSPTAYKVAAENVRILYAAGVPLLAGTDAGNPGTAHGTSLLGEIELLNQAGLSPVEALAAATSLPAKYFSLHDRGRIAVGLRADLVLVNGDPTEDVAVIRNIADIWMNGYAVDRKPPTDVAETAPGESLDPKDIVFSDFDHGKIGSRFGAGWSETTDQVVAGHSTVSTKLVSPGAPGTAAALDVRGDIEPGFVFPWAGTMLFPGSKPTQPVDLSGRKSIRFWVRGDGREYNLMLFTSVSPNMPSIQTFKAGADWQEVTIALSGFKGADLHHVTGIAFAAGMPKGVFDFALDTVSIP